MLDFEMKNISKTLLDINMDKEKPK